MPVTINGTTGVVFPDGVTQGSGVPTASGTSGAPLVSNGTIYTQNTAVGVAFGGTGATDAGTARSNLGTNDAANITTGTLSSSRLPTTGVNAASITTGTLAVANGGTGTATPSLVAGSGITITGSFPNQTVAATGGGTVTSVATGNGLSGGTITTSGTLTIACPSFNSIGSYTWGVMQRNAGSAQNYTAGTNYSAGSGNMQMQTGAYDTNVGWANGNQLSGTWKWMSASGTLGGNLDYIFGLACRVS